MASMRARPFVATLAALLALGRADDARADSAASPAPPGRDLAGDHAISVAVAPAAYLQLSPEELILGMKLRLGYATPVARPLRLAFDLGLTRGGWLAGSDVGTSVGTRDVAIEPTVGAISEGRLNASAWLTGKVAVGPLFVWPNSVYAPASVGGIARLTGGLRHLVSSSVAIGVDLSGAVAAGRFKLRPYETATFLVSFELALVVETRI
jgi:hypothetical protein